MTIKIDSDSPPKIDLSKVCAEAFKLEMWISSGKAQPPGSSGVKGCALLLKGGLVPGEMQVGNMIQILSGATSSYLDVLMGYSVASGTVFCCFHEGIDWVQELSFHFP